VDVGASGMIFNLLQLSEPPADFSRSKVLVPLSGGINSAAILCMLGEHHPDELKPEELHLYYAHFKEHSPDTFQFVADCIRYARKRFPKVVVKITRNSVNKYFLSERMIPHPTFSPCSLNLKILPMQAYDRDNDIDVVLIGFVKEELGRFRRAVERQKQEGRAKDNYPLLTITDEDCFLLVKQGIGWYPKIYDIRWTEEHFRAGLCRRHEIGRRVFTHNNCLPCKNMTKRQLEMVGLFFPTYAEKAQTTANAIPGAYWGRDDVPAVFVCDKCERLEGQPVVD
jgi:3'-phosphoadenosine 5'-phosphosulfate sulfotransferase (PAPS reductase)/FAD synthetase